MAITINKQGLKKFIEKWSGKGKEKQDDESFWIDLFQDVFSQTAVTDRLKFQKDLIGPDGTTVWIDVYIPETNVIIEQKSLGVQLDKPQPSHNNMTPYEQAKMYDNYLPRSEKARWIVTCNFGEFWIYDMEKRNPESDIIKISLDELDKKYHMLHFLINPRIEQIRREYEISDRASKLIGSVYDALTSQYEDDPTEEEYRSLNLFCVRLVFCYYAEDAELFGKYQFRDYIADFKTKHLRNGLKDLFRILDTKENDRDRNEEPELLKFPYVNGGLFSDRNVSVPQIDENTHKLMVEASDFNWSEISPTIFGALFESTLNQETRRNNGMHYTAVENIHKVIDPLFLNDLKAEFRDLCEYKQPNVKKTKLREFQDKLSKLTFFDPACGSGNFLTETYLSLRELENAIIEEINKNEYELVDKNINPIKIQLNQFYGIEINDFAVSVAKTAMWIAENQMMNKTKSILYNAESLSFLPLSSYVNIKEKNALEIDWGEVIQPEKCSYIIGNPPFVGTKLMSKRQKEDTKRVLGKLKNYGVLDYVACWFKRASDYIRGTSIKCALVSTNSLVQGEQVNVIWKDLLTNDIHIDFAYHTFVWDSEAQLKAHVNCVIVGFSSRDDGSTKSIYTSEERRDARNINGYLVDAPNVFIDNRKIPLCSVQQMHNGCKFLDDGNYVFTKEQMEAFVRDDNAAEKFMRPYLGSQNFLSGEKLYCIWLKNAEPSEIKKSPAVLQRIEKVKRFREACKSPDTNKYANRPMLPTRLAYYSEDRDSDMLLVPIVSSERREYIPIGFVDKSNIVSYSCMVIPEATLYTFGVMNSRAHMAWMRTVCGRLEMRYRYSNTIVYNNFPWPTPSEDQRAKIEQTAQKILDAREIYHDSSLAALYDPLTMPIELRKAHEANDKTVMKAYGFDPNMEESDIVAELMKMYQNLTEDK